LERIGLGALAVAVVIISLLARREIDQPRQLEEIPPLFEPIASMRAARERTLRRQAISPSEPPLGHIRLGIDHKPSTHDIQINAPAASERQGA
jgi:hypothetical protein